MEDVGAFVVASPRHGSHITVHRYATERANTVQRPVRAGIHNHLPTRGKGAGADHLLGGDMPSWTERITKAVVAGSLAATGLVAGAGSAHADIILPGGAHDCRSSTQPHNAYKLVIDNIYVDSCYAFFTNGYTMLAVIQFTNGSGQSVTYCAHALDVNHLNGPWAHDFGCTSSDVVSDTVVAGWDKPYGPSWENWDAPGGKTYVISAGLWLNGHYYGDVESPKAYVGPH